MRLKWAQEPSEAIKHKIQDIFANITKNSTEKNNGLITTLRFTSHDDSNYATLANGGSRNTYNMHKKANVALKAYSELLKTDKDTALNYYKQDLTIPAPYCPDVEKIECKKDYPYRSIRGSCNNLLYPWWGMKETPYKRLLPPAYEDGVAEPRSLSVTGYKLPHPRRLAMTIHAPRDTESEWNLLFVFWGQTIAHDITLLASATYADGKPKRCTCGSTDSDCMTVWTLPDDEINQDQKCMTVTKSSGSTRDFNCNLGPKEQMNLVTHWLDGSFLYGSDTKTLEKLRTFEGGLMRVSRSEYSNLDQLPLREGVKCPNPDRTVRCFKAGEARVEDNVMLASIHTMMLREHNRLAKELSYLNPYWEDETIFQEARKILVAEFQHITYNEFLPSVLGYKKMRESCLEPLSEGYLYKYDPYRYPQVINEFATNAFRSFHTLVSDEQITANYKFKKIETMDVGDFQFNSTLSSNHLDGVLYGIVAHHSYIPSPRINPSMNNELFDKVFSNDQTKRWSLPMFNVLRAREHGIPSYNFYRKLCGLKYANSFDDLINEIPAYLIEKMKELYDSVHDVDLFTGMVSERARKHTVTGPTGACKRIFLRLRYNI